MGMTPLIGYNRNMEAKKSQIIKTSILDLPSYVLIDIISRLPLQNVFISRCVCKSWHNMLEPFFAKRYMLHAPTLVMLRLRCCGIENPKNLYLVSLQNPPLFPTTLRYAIGNFRPWNSCNGLVCLCHGSSNPVGVWNPLLGEYKILPEARYSHNNEVASGLGFNAATNEYKVIRILKPVGEYCNWQAEIYTLGGTDSWRSIGVAPYSFDCQLCATYINGALNWLVHGHDSQLICTFDLRSEKFKCFPPPLVKNQCYWSNLGVFDDCLYICGSDAIALSPDVEIWVMNNSGLKECWAKLLNIKNPLIEWWNPNFQLQLIKFLSNGELLLFCGNQCFLYYNCRDRTFKGPYKLSFAAVAHFPSFISLDEVTKGDYSKVRNVKSAQLIKTQHALLLG